MTLTRRPLILGLAAAALGGAAPPAGQMQVTLLGTASPQPNINRFGPCTLVQAGGLNLVFDAGRGCVIRLDQVGVAMGKVDATFITHFHSDHLNGLPDLWMTGYIQTPFGNRRAPMRLYGPTGTVRIANSMRETFKDDIAIRMADEHVPEAGTRIDAHEFAEAGGVVFNERGVKVTAFAAPHGDLIHPSVGYRVDYAGRSVALSGDTRPSQILVSHAKGVDLLIHEVFVMPPQAEKDPTATVVRDHHTTPEQAGQIFSQVRPRLAVYSHIVQLRRPGMKSPTIADVLARTRKTYKGPLAAGEDLTRYTLTAQGVTGERLSNTARPG
jgi:ribonuclease Z